MESTIAFTGNLSRELVYGENRRQKGAALYASPGAENDPLALDKFEQIAGGDPSYINLTDLDRLVETATRTAAAFKLNSGAVPLMGFAVKHGNCCGAAVGSDKHGVMARVVMGDREAISGGFVLSNFTTDEVCAKTLQHQGMQEGKRIIDGIIAPGFDDAAIELLGRKNGKCRFFMNSALAGEGLACIDPTMRFRKVRGGMLVQDGDPFVLGIPAEWELTETERDDLLLAWGVGSTANSNTIVLVKDGMLIGSGTGQRSRVMAAKLALLYAETYGHDVEGAFAYSDSFFPFEDGPEVLAKAGVKKIFATSGSVRDEFVKKRCEKLGVRLYLLPDASARGFYGH